jgi:hypothetical protein
VRAFLVGPLSETNKQENGDCLMNAHDNADMLIKTIKIWQFLQHVDELIDNGDRKASIVVTDFFKRYDLPFEISVENLKSAGVLPFAQLKTHGIPFADNALLRETKGFHKRKGG